MSNSYDLHSVKLPRMAGTALRLFTAILENPAGQAALLGTLLKNSGVVEFRQKEIDEPPTNLPTWELPEQAIGKPIEPEALANPETGAAGDQPAESFHFASFVDYAKLYRSGQLFPLDIAQRASAAIAASNAAAPPLRAVIASQEADIQAQAQASAERFRQERPLSLLDGVPVAIKDELDQFPYPTTVGTRFLGKSFARADATVVARLRAAGALLIGKTNMHEIGIGVTGQNPHHGTPRNPYAPDRYTGGSSSGSAAAVAAGLCPIAVGADGGGSIRIPASFCGVVGLKCTFGRVSEYGAYPLDWSVAHVGPLAASARDAALAYALMAGPDPLDHISQTQPPLTLDDFDNPDLRGLRIGVYRPWFEHATPEVTAVCQQMLLAFERLGAQIVEIEIPDLEPMRVAHVISITSEMAASLDRFHPRHNADYSLEVRLNLCLARSFTSRDYVHAQRMRTCARANFANALRQVDVIATPGTALAAPLIPPDALPDGESDLTTLTEIMRYAFPANLTGLPAIAFPAGYTPAGLPVGFQLMGRPWAEHTLLRLAHLAEQVVARRKPQIFFDLLAS